MRHNVIVDVDTVMLCNEMNLDRHLLEILREVCRQLLRVLVLVLFIPM